MTAKKTQPKQALNRRIVPKDRRNRATKNKRESIENDLDDALGLKTLSQSDGGITLLRGLMADLVLAIDTMVTQSQDLTLSMYCDLTARIRERLVLIRQITGAEADVDILTEILKEEIEREKAEKSAEAADRETGMTDQSEKKAS